jgi:C_GCAxxG_C_C family probable redox protein
MKGEEAVATFTSGFNCAQSTFLPFAKAYGLGEKEAALLASSFGAGMGRTQEYCGAVTGGMMALGLDCGFSDPTDQGGKDRALAATKAFLADFRARFGSLRCKDLIGCDLNTDEGQRYHKESGQRDEVCAKCVSYAACWVEARAKERS